MHFVSFPRKNSKTQSSLNFLQSGPRKLTKSDFSGLAPIQRVLREQHSGEATGSRLVGGPGSWYCRQPPTVQAVARGQKFMCCLRNPRNIKIFVRAPGREDSGTRPGGSVTGVTEKLFMCQMLMCLFRPLNFPESMMMQLHQLQSETNLASRWEGVRFPRASGKSPDLLGSFPNFPGSFSATSPEVLSLWN